MKKMKIELLFLPTPPWLLAKSMSQYAASASKETYYISKETYYPLHLHVTVCSFCTVVKPPLHPPPPPATPPASSSFIAVALNKVVKSFLLLSSPPPPPAPLPLTPRRSAALRVHLNHYEHPPSGKREHVSACPCMCPPPWHACILLLGEPDTRLLKTAAQKQKRSSVEPKET